MYERLATYIQQNLVELVEQYDAQLRIVQGYVEMPERARRDLEQRVLTLIAESLEKNSDQLLIDYIHERAKQVLAHGFEPEWLQRAITIAQDIITPLVRTLEESNFVWQAMSQAQAAAWEIASQERQRIEATLRDNEARYQIIFDSTPIMFWLKDTQNRTLRINKAAAEFEGVNPADVEGKSAYDLYPREQAEAYYQDDLEVIHTNRPKPGIVEQHTSVGTGNLMWVETGKTPVHNDQGEVVGVLAFAVDITERKLAEEARHQTAEQQQLQAHRLRATLEAAHELIRIPELDLLYRRAVELAREKFDVERCGLYMIDESRDYLWGTYGTDDQRHTSDERGSRRTVDEFKTILTASPEQMWVVRETPHVYVKDGEQHIVGSGWVVGTVLRGAAGPIGILFNDCALSGHPVDEAQQESLALYCSLIGPIIDRKRLEEQVQESLVRRGVQVQTTTEVAQEIASATDLNELFGSVVTLIKERFNYYHAQLFRYEPAQDAVVLITGYGEIGQKMLEAGHKLQMGRGVVGTAAATGKSILATDIRRDADWRPNPYLPDTNGELAVPIKWRDQVLGILDVQSDRAGALTQEDQLLLEGLCGQIAIAIESKRTEEALAYEQYLMYALMNNLPDAIYFKDKHSRFIRISHSQSMRFGLSNPAQAIGKSDFDFFTEEHARPAYEDEQQIIQTGQPITKEERETWPDRPDTWVLTTKLPLRDETGQIVGTFGVSKDITDRKQAEEKAQNALREMERLYATVAREGWQVYRQTANLPEAYLYDRSTVQPVKSAGLPPVDEAVSQLKLVTAEIDHQPVATAPLDVRGEVVGALGIYDDPNQPLPAEDLELVKAVSEQVALALESARLFDQTQMALAETRALFRFSDLVSREAGTKSIYDSVAQLLVEEIGFVGAWIAQVDTQDQVLRGIAGAGLGMGPDRNFDVVPYQHMQTPATIAARDRAMIVVNDPLHDERLSDLPDQMKVVVGKAIAVPIIIDGEIESVIAATRPVDGLDIGERDQRLLQTAAAQVAIAIQRARLFERTQRDAQRERTIAAISERIYSTTDVKDLLRITAEELRRATGSARAVVKLGRVSSQPGGSTIQPVTSDEGVTQ